MADPVTASMGLMAAGTVLSAGGQIRQGRQQRDAANYEAAQLEQSASQQIASSQRAAMSDEQQARMAQSRALAVAAASGGGASDPTVINIISRLAGEGAYRGMVDLYQGQEKARQLNEQATMTRMQGEQAASNSKLSALSTVLSGAGSMYTRYAADHRPSGQSSSVSFGRVDNTVF